MEEGLEEVVVVGGVPYVCYFVAAEVVDGGLEGIVDCGD